MSAHDPVRATDRLNRIWGRGKEFLGTELPIMCGAMTWISPGSLDARSHSRFARPLRSFRQVPPDFSAVLNLPCFSARRPGFGFP